ncbi:hypothetical protein HCN44_007638 [Aphidius gifuensis]|uniref:Probable RNA-binding protein EIF1AD n=1 Tax=Aphidius gifuensis TaxID=684658 RepID=A0A835CM93_APHGI|nr:probable RNA-binding protein EIF1AD [Aphidius gifuensis]KAF7988144.1 hypothetical protein HCN44_007638 [Aphidius gifuensis]
MSSATKRKHVTKESQEECLTVPEESQSIVQVIESKGNNLHEVMESSGAQYLVSMPGKFRRNIWVKRGNYVIVEPIPEGDKVKAEIVKILTKDHIKFFRANNCWPNKFDNDLITSESKDPIKHDESNSQSEDDNDDDLFVNTNRQQPHQNTDLQFDESSDSSDSD